MKGGRERKRVNEVNPIHVGGFDLFWEKRHPLYVDWRKELKGLSVSVWKTPGRSKELILDVHFAFFGVERQGNADQWNQVLVRAIRSAMEAGWDPDSRGSALRHTPS